MKNTRLRALAAGALTVSAATAVHAGTQPYFTPLTGSSAVAPPNHIDELNSPWQAPAGIEQKNLVNLRAVAADVNQSIQRAANAGMQASMFDMLAYDPTGRYVFIPHETPWGAGVSRHDTQTRTTELLFAGNQSANVCSSSAPVCPQWEFDFGAFDPSRWTPNGTLIAAEEWTGRGRVRIAAPAGAGASRSDRPGGHAGHRMARAAHPQGVARGHQFLGERPAAGDLFHR